MANKKALNEVTNRLGPPSRMSTVPTAKERYLPGGVRPSLMPSSSISSKSSSRASVAPNRRTTINPGIMDVRRSSAFGHGPTSRKDPRPINDRKYVAEMTRKLVDFLNQKSYSPNMLSVQNFQSGISQAEFLSILQFLTQKFLHPLIDSSTFNFDKANKSATEDIIELFKRLRYPLLLNKSQLSSFAPHYWPSLLLMLIWLIELIEYDYIIVKEESEVISTGRQSEWIEHTEEKLFFNYLGKAYERWLMAGDQEEDIMKELDQEWGSSFDLKNKQIQKEMETLAFENEILTSEIETILKAGNRVLNLNKKKIELSGDSSKFNGYIAELERHIKKLQKTKEEKEMELEMRNRELEQSLKEKEDLLKIYNEQELKFGSVELEKMIKSRNILEENLSSLNRSKEEMEKNIWEKEQSQKAKFEQIEKLMATFNLQVNNNLNNLNNKEDDTSMDFNIPLLKFEQNENKERELDTKKNVKPKLKTILKLLTDQTENNFKEQIQIKESIEMEEETVMEKREEIILLEGQLEKIQTSCKIYKKQISEQLKTRGLEAENLNLDNIRMRNENKILVEESKKKLERCKEEHNLFVEKASKEKDETMKWVVDMGSELVNEKNVLSQKLEAVRKELEEQLKSLKVCNFN